jgi:RNA polymerase sigma-70 factor (ECF subfamily)
VVAGPGERQQARAREAQVSDVTTTDEGRARTTADGAAVRAGDKLAFARLVRRHEHELRAHCLRIVGSVAEAEDMVQETFLRAWRNRASFEGRSGVRTWLYRIATNACVDALRRRSHPVGRAVAAGGRDAGDGPAAPEPPAPQDQEPGEAVAARETIEQAMLSIIDLLPARQRAVLILRDVYGWTAGASASHLDTTVAATNSALQRARATMRANRPDGAAPGPAPAVGPSDHQRAVIRCLAAAHEQSDGAAVATLAVAAG